ncbi:MAG TPA: hypothetical protein VGA00_08240 [Acidiferrobacterales bacterium]
MNTTGIFAASVAIAALAAVGILPAQAQDQGLLDLGGDLRLGAYGLDRDDRDGTRSSNGDWRARIRPGVGVRLSDSVSAKLRLAGRYTTDDVNTSHFELFEAIPTTDGLRFGDSTVDELYLRVQPDPRWTAMLGRMQTKFELEGVAKKSLSRNDSPNVDITWTDGLLVQHKTTAGTSYYTILQRSTDEGPTTVRRAPLAFTENASHVTYYFGMEKKSKRGLIAQRGWDITYIPDSLRKDGTAGGRIEDYYGITGRLALQWPIGQGATRFMLSGEAAYAPNTPTEAALGIGGTDDVSGLAIHTSANFIDFVPKHSFGLVYGQARGGWLLSPDFVNNMTLIEGRYAWRFAENQIIDMRLRRREDYEQLTTATQQRTDTDYYVRYTARF